MRHLQCQYDSVFDFRSVRPDWRIMLESRFLQFERLVMGTALRLAATREDAEDYTQDVWLRLARMIRAGVPPGVSMLCVAKTVSLENRRRVIGRNRDGTIRTFESIDLWSAHYNPWPLVELRIDAKAEHERRVLERRRKQREAARAKRANPATRAQERERELVLQRERRRRQREAAGA